LMAGTQHLAFGGKNMVSASSSSSSGKKRE
jgi:hypothetical protein